MSLASGVGEEVGAYWLDGAGGGGGEVVDGFEVFVGGPVGGEGGEGRLDLDCCRHCEGGGIVWKWMKDGRLEFRISIIFEMEVVRA